MKELKLRKCNSCGATVKVLTDCNCPCGIICCEEKMEEVVPNSVEASFEKHLPTYEIVDNKIKVKVNHVMEDDHYIEWVTFVTNDKEETVYFNSGETAEAEFPYEKGILYSYCNIHGLWMSKVD